MDFNLTDNGTVAYSPYEREIFKLLGTEPRDTRTIAKLRYKKEAPPFYVRQVVVGALKSLARKAKHNREPFRIAHTKRSGSIPMSFWLEQKQ